VYRHGPTAPHFAITTRSNRVEPAEIASQHIIGAIGTEGFLDLDHVADRIMQECDFLV
jgi:hypothetical protein